MQLWYESDQNLLRPPVPALQNRWGEKQSEVSRGETSVSSGPYRLYHYFHFFLDMRLKIIIYAFYDMLLSVKIL